MKLKLRPLEMGPWLASAGFSEEASNEADSASVRKTAACVQLLPVEGTARVGGKKHCWGDANRTRRKPREQVPPSSFSLAVFL